MARRVAAAFERRRQLLPPQTTVFRAVHGAADGIPGVAVDVYDHVALCQLYDAAALRQAASLVPALLERCSSLRLVERRRGGAATGEVDRWHGSRVAHQVVQELGLRFEVRHSEHFLGTGLFPDQRPQRARVRQLAQGRRVCNLFAYAGGFTVAAALGGAASVDHVDLSHASLRWAAANLSLNGADPRAHRFLAEDARDWLDKAWRRGVRYDLLIVDPPAFASGGRQVFRAQRDLKPLIAQAARLCTAGGLLLACCNLRGTRGDQLATLASAACQQAGRTPHLLAQGGAGDDFPAVPEERTLWPVRAVWVQVE